MILKIMLYYLLFSALIGLLYVYLYNKYFMPDIVKKATFKQKLKTYALLYSTVTIIAPYSLYEILKTNKKGGFKK